MGGGCGVEDFEAAYAANRQNAINVMLSHDPVAKAVRALVAKKKFTGDMEDLLEAVGPTTGIGSTKKLSDELRRLMPALRTVGVHVVLTKISVPAMPQLSVHPAGWSSKRMLLDDVHDRPACSSRSCVAVIDAVSSAERGQPEI
jgi:hypothetical protein